MHLLHVILISTLYFLIHHIEIQFVFSPLVTSGSKEGTQRQDYLAKGTATDTSPNTWLFILLLLHLPNSYSLQSDHTFAFCPRTCIHNPRVVLECYFLLIFTSNNSMIALKNIFHELLPISFQKILPYFSYLNFNTYLTMVFVLAIRPHHF